MISSDTIAGGAIGVGFEVELLLESGCYDGYLQLGVDRWLKV